MLIIATGVVDRACA